MGKETPPSAQHAKSTKAARAARLKAALKANIAKRKAQARARDPDADDNRAEKT